MQRETLCYCGNSVKHDFPETVDISQDTGMVDAILEGTFLEVTCDACGATLKPDFPVLLEHVPAGGNEFSIDYIPEPDRVRYLSGKINSKAQRVVIGYPELREKVLIFSSGLDDRVIEILKFLLLEKAETAEALTIILEEQTDEQLTFYIYGLKKDEVGITTLPMDMYRKAADSLEIRIQQEEYAQILSPPYVSINKISLVEEEEE